MGKYLQQNITYGCTTTKIHALLKELLKSLPGDVTMRNSNSNESNINVEEIPKNKYIDVSQNRSFLTKLLQHDVSKIELL